MKKLATIFCLILLSSAARPVFADGIGLSVFGYLSVPSIGSVNYFDSSNLGVPPGYGNSATNGTVVIGPGIEFGATNFEDLLTIDYTGSTVTITDKCVSTGCGTTPYTITLFSPSITGYTTNLINFPNVSVNYGFDAAYGGNVGTFSFGGAPNFTGGTALFDYTSTTPPVSAVPEPWNPRDGA